MQIMQSGAGAVYCLLTCHGEAILLVLLFNISVVGICSVVVLEESLSPRVSSMTSVRVLVLVLVLGSSSPRKFSRIE